MSGQVPCFSKLVMPYGGNEMALPDVIRDILNESSPKWTHCATAGWIVVRIFDDGREVERVAALGAARRFWPCGEGLPYPVVADE